MAQQMAMVGIAVDSSARRGEKILVAYVIHERSVLSAYSSGARNSGERNHVLIVRCAFSGVSQALRLRVD